MAFVSLDSSQLICSFCLFVYYYIVTIDYVDKFTIILGFWKLVKN